MLESYEIAMPGAALKVWAVRGIMPIAAYAAHQIPGGMGKSLDATRVLRCSTRASRLHVPCSQLSPKYPHRREQCRTKIDQALSLSIIRH